MGSAGRPDRLGCRRDHLLRHLHFPPGPSRRARAPGAGGAGHPEAHGAERPCAGEGHRREPVLPVLHWASVVCEGMPVHLQHPGPLPEASHGGDAHGGQRGLPGARSAHSGASAGAEAGQGRPGTARGLPRRQWGHDDSGRDLLARGHPLPPGLLASQRGEGEDRRPDRPSAQSAQDQG